MANATNKRALVIAAAVGATLVGASVQAAVIIKANNTDALNLGSSWTGGNVPGSGDIATWDSTITAANTTNLGANMQWLGISVQMPTGQVLINDATKILTLGSAGIDLNSASNLVINPAIALSSAQTWSASSGRVLGAGAAVNTGGYQLTLAGPGTKQFKGAFSGGGDVLITGGSYQLSGVSASSSNVTANSGTTVFFDSGLDGQLGATRANSVAMKGATLNAKGNKTVNTADTVTNALSADSGANAVTFTLSGKNSLVAAGSFSRSAGATMRFSGASLGASTLSSPAATSSNVSFATTPTMTNNIIVGAFGDNALVTYDNAYGVRPMDTAGLYTSGLSGGGTSNALLENSAGTGIVTTTLNSDTTVNSLTLRVSGVNTAAGSGLTIDGSGTLKLATGMLYANQSATGASGTGNANNAMLVSSPTLDMNGQEGIIAAYTNNVSNSVASGRLEITSAITNAAGLTKSGTGEARFTGASANTYSGTTTVNEGVLTLGKTTGVNAIGGDLLVNGGRVQNVASNQIPDTASITINSGTYSLQYSNSGSVYSESFKNLTMNGGSYVSGTADHGAASNVLGSANLAGGAMSISRQQNVSITGPTSMSGTTISVSRSQSTTIGTYNTYLALNGGLSIANTASGSYTPISLDAGDATHSGAKLLLGGDVSFTGNATNANTVTINAPTGTNVGVVDLNGATRTFTIGNGAAAADLTIVAPIINGGLTKTGPGTLALGGANTYTGATTITAGTLQLGAAGSIASTLVDLGAGASLDTTAKGTFAMSGAQTIKFELDPSNAGSAGLLSAASLDITSGVVEFGTAGILNDPVYVLATYTPGSLTGTQFASISNKPEGYSIDYSYNGNSIALTVPEPGTIALASIVAGLSLMARRRAR